MNRRLSDRRNVQKREYLQRVQMSLVVFSFLFSCAALVFSVKGNAKSSAVVHEECENKENSREYLSKKAEGKVEKLEKSTKTAGAKKSQSNRSKRAAKRVQVQFEESVARAPATVTSSPSESGPKTIRYSNDLYEKEDLL